MKCSKPISLLLEFILLLLTVVSLQSQSTDLAAPSNLAAEKTPALPPADELNLYYSQHNRQHYDFDEPGNLDELSEFPEESAESAVEQIQLEKKRSTESWLDQKHLTWNWWGFRDDLAKKGIVFTGSYVSDFLCNPVGGMRHAFQYDHSIGADLILDLEKLADLKGLQFHASMVSRAGRNLSKLDIGNSFTVSSIYGGRNTRLYALYLEQSLFEDRLKIRAGRFGALDDFLASHFYWNFVSNALDGNPISVPFNSIHSVYPTSSWGFQVKGKPTEDFYIMSGVFNSDTTLGEYSTHGANFKFSGNQGALIMGQTGYLLNQEKGAIGMPGSYNVGGFYITGDFIEFAPPNNITRGNSGVYVAADQMIYREGPPEVDQGLTSLFAVTLAPPENNTFPLFYMVGLIYEGLIPDRDDDKTSLGIAYGEYSGDLRENQRALGIAEQDYEMILDLSYQYFVTPWLILQPDVQYVFKPGGTGNIPDAVVAGMRVSINF